MGEDLLQKKAIRQGAIDDPALSVRETGEVDKNTNKEKRGQDQGVFLPAP